MGEGGGVVTYRERRGPPCDGTDWDCFWRTERDLLWLMFMAGHPKQPTTKALRMSRKKQKQGGGKVWCVQQDESGGGEARVVVVVVVVVVEEGEGGGFG